MKTGGRRARERETGGNGARGRLPQPFAAAALASAGERVGERGSRGRKASRRAREQDASARHLSRDGGRSSGSGMIRH